MLVVHGRWCIMFIVLMLVVHGRWCIMSIFVEEEASEAFFPFKDSNGWRV
jgi:hypothetical protein